MDFVYGLLQQLGVSLPHWALVAISALVPAVALITFMAAGPIVYVYVERKIAGFMQDRLGPMRVGPWGLLQTVADAVKLLFKEAIYPAGADKKLFVLAPCLVVLGAFLSFVVIPFGPNLVAADLNVGAFYVVAVSSVSYEIPAVLSLMTVVMLVGSLSLQDIVAAQAGGFDHWFLFRYFPLMPIVFLVFFTATLAECNRTPFDIPEAESELVAGFHTEYSGFFLAMFFMAEYTEMFIVSATASVLFLGGWASPFPPDMPVLGWTNHPALAPAILIAKAWGLVFVHMWLRWTLPRLRVDQLMHVAWKVLLPIAMVLAVVIGGLVLWPQTAAGFGVWDRAWAYVTTAGIVFFLIYVAGAALRWNGRRVQEYAA
jgi:NADH-quinone oxidoreductase subunit H